MAMIVETIRGGISPIDSEGEGDTDIPPVAAPLLAWTGRLRRTLSRRDNGSYRIRLPRSNTNHKLAFIQMAMVQRFTQRPNPLVMQEITVLVNNQPGAVADVTAVLAAADINIEELDAEGVIESGVITLCVDQHNEGLVALKEAGFDVYSEDALIIKLDDKPGALAGVAGQLKAANINLKSLRIIDHVGPNCLASIVADDQAAARKVLKDVILSL